MPNLDRFLNAQQGTTGSPNFQKAYNEIKRGAKTSHWIWYIFPQLKALGYSSTAKHYGIEDFSEACKYLQNQELFQNYYAIAQLVAKQLDAFSLASLMGSDVDAQKLASSLTLFHEAAVFLREQQASTSDYEGFVDCCDEIFIKMQNQGYFHCENTLAILDKTPTRVEFPSATLSPTRQVANPLELPRVRADNRVQPHPVITNPIELSTISPARDYSVLSEALGNYIDTRRTEWSFHYNFLGLMSVIYWLHDAVWGTDYFNNKSREVKVCAATHLKQMIDSKDCETVNLTNTEKIALANDSLGDLVNSHGGLDSIMRSIRTEQNQNSTTLRMF